MPSTYSEFKFETFIGGLNTDLDAEMLPKHFLAAGKNIQYNSAILSKRDGHSLFGPVAPFAGTANGIFVFQKSSGAAFLLVKTTTNLYNYSVVSNTWLDITPPGIAPSAVGVAPQFVTWNDKVYCTDLTNPIITWDGAAATASLITGNGAPDWCTSLRPFTSYLFAFRPQVAGVFYGFRAMWSDLGDATKWNTGQSGAVDLSDTAEQTQTADVFGRWMAIYKQRSIYNTSFIGLPVFFDFRRLDTPGILARRTLVRIPNLGLFALGPDDVYVNDSTQARPIGKPIRQQLFSNLNYAAVDSAHAYVRPDLGRVYLNVPFGSAVTPDTTFAYSYLDGQWMPDGPYP